MAISVPKTRVTEGLPHPLGATWDGLGVNFALFSAYATKVELCLFDARRRTRAGTHRTARIHRRGLARLLARRPPRHGLRLPRARPVRSRERPSLQPPQAAARPLRQGACRSAQVGTGGVRLHAGRRGRRSDLRRARQRAPDAEMPRHRPRLHLGPRSAAAGRRGSRRSSTRPMSAVTPSCIPPCPSRLRGTFAGLAVKEVVDYIRDLGVTTVELLPIHTFINDSMLLEKGLTNYWGYNTIGFFAPDPRYSAQQLDGRVQGDDRAPARCRARSDPRRRLQPHRRRQRARADAIVPRHRQRLLLPAAARPAALLHQRYRNRQHAQSLASARAADGDGQPALLGAGDARGRVPLRSRPRSSAASRTASTKAAASSTAAGRTPCCRA